MGGFERPTYARFAGRPAIPQSSIRTSPNIAAAVTSNAGYAGGYHPVDGYVDRLHQAAPKILVEMTPPDRTLR